MSESAQKRRELNLASEIERCDYCQQNDGARAAPGIGWTAKLALLLQCDASEFG